MQADVPRREFVRLPLAITLVVLLFCQLVAAGSIPAAESEIMPLAEHSLLLDGQVIGDRLIVVGERGHVLTSEDAGRSWQQQVVPTRATLTSVYFIDSATGWAAGYDSVVLQTRDGGRTWSELYSDSEDDRPILDLWFRNSSHGYAIGAYGLFLETHDGGRNWYPAKLSRATLVVDAGNEDDPSGEDEEGWVDFHLNQISVTASGRLIIAAEAGKLYRSDDGYSSWLSLPSPYEGSFYGSLPLSSGRLLLFGLRGHLFRTEDEGASWSQVDSGTQATLNDGLRLADGRIAIGGLAGALLLSTNNGESFTQHPQADRAGIVKLLQAKDGALILIGEKGVRRLELPGEGQGSGR